MYIVQTKERIGKMTFKIEGHTAYPSCKRAKRACELVSEDYLLPSQLKMLEIMGFEIDYKKSDGFRPILTRSFL
jgi:hypothetical protein